MSSQMRQEAGDRRLCSEARARLSLLSQKSRGR